VSLAEALPDLQRLTERLRRDCPWDRQQTATTITLGNALRRVLLSSLPCAAVTSIKIVTVLH
jgi:hypothetical protein